MRLAQSHHRALDIEFGVQPRRALAGLVLLGILLTPALARSQEGCQLSVGDKRTTGSFSMQGTSIRMPLGAVLLIRKNGQVGAIRLKRIDSAGTIYGTSVYESYFFANSSDTVGSSATVRQSGELEIKPLKGPGRGLWIYKTGAYRALIGKWVFDFTTPDTIWMLPEHHNRDHDYEFAPTSACDVSQIDANDKRLRWFRYNPNASVILSLADLPK